ncbi:heterodimeric methylmalonyl-CoA mutase small subunit [Nannocystis exedens]|uniref:Heterodimeric methylmalonyl-CoA mutase small subunit n=1 Tax=Nannocystis exedens TaxID=54 RepID=A0A1I1U805_9BACT|nr:methylmalonyl-CoA mutase family protein [Nannocystis exedens]PCC71426.1 methylmalonyl-CoA mutase [Nannocystis exedens]SFD65708.1 heterodimeric methylmalonyl-CoA mutase small subunit [Nannocystis exedens]
MADDDATRDSLCGFPPVTLADWRELATRELGGASTQKLVARTPEGLELAPLVTAEDVGAAVPRAPLLARSRRGWAVAQEYRQTRAHAAGAAAADDLSHGTEAAWFVLDEAVAAGVASGRAAAGEGAAGGDADSGRAEAAASEREVAKSGRTAATEVAAGEREVAKRGRTAVAASEGAGVGRGSEGRARAGVVVGDAADVAALLAGVDLARAEVVIDAGVRALPVAAALAAEAERRNVAPGQLRGAVAGDPLALLLAVGEIGWSIEHVYQDMAELTGWARATAPGLRTALVDATAWHEAGASAADEIAGALAVALEHLRGLVRAGATIDAAAEALLFVLAVGRDLPLELAKLRAARSLWARVAAACGVGPEGQVMRLHARASRRELSNLDPWVNLIRATTEGVTAALGGADSVALPALDEALGEPSPLGRRLARNTQLLLRDESHLGAVQDPAGGSYSIERTTEALARAAWDRLQAIEREGGLLASLRAGAVQERAAAAARAQEQAVATLRLPIVGASRYAARPMGPRLGAQAERDAAAPGAGERGAGDPGSAGRSTRPSEGEAAVGDAGRAGASRSAGRDAAVPEDLSHAPWPDVHALRSMSEVQAKFVAGRGLGGFVRPGPGERVTPLGRGRLAAPFEALRARGEALGSPKVALVPFGTASEVRPRVEYARAYFPVGGFEVVEAEATEELQVAAARFANSGARVAVICGTDARYATAVPELVPGLKAAGARVIVLAGRPKDQWEALAAAGVDVFIAAGADVLAALGAVQQRLEVHA